MVGTSALVSDQAELFWHPEENAISGT